MGMIVLVPIPNIVVRWHCLLCQIFQSALPSIVFNIVGRD